MGLPTWCGFLGLATVDRTCDRLANLKRIGKDKGGSFHSFPSYVFDGSYGTSVSIVKRSIFRLGMFQDSQGEIPLEISDAISTAVSLECFLSVKGIQWGGPGAPSGPIRRQMGTIDLIFYS